jgi:hypothetical protein
VAVSLLAPGIASAGDANRAACPNESLPGYRAYLPDCRAYEMVTPPYKDGFPIDTNATSEDGGRLGVRSFGIFSNPSGTGAGSEAYVLERTSLGWESVPLDAPSSTFSRFEVLATNPEFTANLWIGFPPSPQPVADIYQATSPRGPFVLVGPANPPTVKGHIAVLALLGASRDLSRSVYRVPAPNPGEVSQLWPGDGTVGVGQASLYEYSGTGNLEPRLIGVSDEHEVADIAESHLISECGTALGGSGGSTYNAISESGARIFFTALGSDHGGCGAALPAGTVEPPVDELFARLNGSRTVAISQPSKADCGKCVLSSPADAEFQGASADGSQVFFTTTQDLLAGATGVGANLYEYDFGGPEGGRVTLVSGGDPAGADVQRVVQVSDDGSHVYFVAQGVLTATPNSFGQHAEENAQNLYVYERDVTYPAGNVTFIGQGGAGNAQTTPDGRFLVFESAADLTPDQEGQPEAGQVFEYDAQSGSLVRVSRGQNGYNNDGNSSVYPATIPIQSYNPALPVDKFTKLAVSNDGAYVFFSSEDALASQALSGAANVYEYHSGRVYLISDGHDLTRIFFGNPAVELLGTDESGQNVFFRTADSLLSQDTDTQVDFYDARAEGGFPSPTAEPGCSGDSCQGPLASTQLQSWQPASSSGGESTTAVAPERAVKPKPKPAVGAQKLARALKACRKKHDRRRRSVCEHASRRRYQVRGSKSSRSRS